MNGDALVTLRAQQPTWADGGETINGDALVTSRAQQLLVYLEGTGQKPLLQAMSGEQNKTKRVKHN